MVIRDHRKGVGGFLVKDGLRRVAWSVGPEIFDESKRSPGKTVDELRAIIVDRAHEDYRTYRALGETQSRKADQGSYEVQEKIDEAEREDEMEGIEKLFRRVKEAGSDGSKSPSRVRVLRSCPSVKLRDDLVPIHGGLQTPKRLVGARTRDEIDELYAGLFEESPWLQEVIEWMWHEHLALLDDGPAYFRLPPFLLMGPPGCGKTHLVQRLAELSDAPSARIDMASLSSSFTVTGVEGGWSSARPGEVVCLISRSKAANPIVILDEAEKSRANRGAADPLLALLPLLQRDTAARFQCPAMQAEVDLSHVTWCLTANDIGRLPAPLLDRVKVFHCGSPSGKHLRHHVQRRLGKYAADATVVDHVVSLIESGKISLRGLGRLEEEFRRLDRGGPALN